MKTALMTALILTSTLSFAGAGSSGGGFAVVCNHSNQTFKSAELLDLYEARNRYGLLLIDSTGSFEGDYILSVQNTYHLQGNDDFVVNQDVKKNLDKFLRNVQFIKSPKKLPRINDIGRTISLPTNCTTEQVAFYDDQNGKILIDENLWEKLDTLNQAALVSHESAYFQERKYNESTSENSRAFVAHIYSQNSIPVINDRTRILSFGSTVPTYLKNGEQVISAFYNEQKNGKFILYFTQLFGRPIVTKSKATFDIGNIQFQNSYSEDGKKLMLTSNASKTIKLKTAIISTQSKTWDLELTLFPNGAVKLGLYQNGILLEEEFIEKISIIH